MKVLLKKNFSEYQSGVTEYDRTDRFKRMKDADILAENKRSNKGSYFKSAKAGGMGAALGSAAGALAGAISTKSVAGARKGALAGAAAGAAIGGGTKLAATHKEREQNRFVNRRLSEAQKQARRRESKDWKTNNVNREGYTY